MGQVDRNQIANFCLHKNNDLLISIFLPSKTSLILIIEQNIDGIELLQVLFEWKGILFINPTLPEYELHSYTSLLQKWTWVLITLASEVNDKWGTTYDTNILVMNEN